MSRIILSRWNDGGEHVVVGYDRPLSTYYWQEFAKEHDEDGTPMWEKDEEWEEMIGFAGYAPSELPEISDLFAHAATHNHDVFNTMMNVENLLLPALEQHRALDYPASNLTIDLSIKE